MPRTAPAGVPQVLSIVRMTKNGGCSLKKVVRQHTNVSKGRAYLLPGNEVLITPERGPGALPLEIKGHRAMLPEEIVQRLGLSANTLCAFVQRNGAAAIKRMDIVEQPGDAAAVIDTENATTVTRTAYANPWPEKWIPRLRERYRSLSLRADPYAWLAKRDSLAGWRARKRLDIPRPADAATAEHLIAERVSEQAVDGSWDQQVVLTARRLLELADLGLLPGAPAATRAADWLLARPESDANPGMWFLDDDLIAAQAAVLEQRAQGVSARFRERRRGELTRVMLGSDLLRDPCGPRIMWPNAYAVRALLSLGYEDHPRVQRALRMLSHAHWCECAYQHGTTEWRGRQPVDADTVGWWEESCRQEYHYGGVGSLDELAEMDLSKVTMVHMVRDRVQAHADGDAYPLRMPDHIQPCELMTVWGMASVSDPLLQRLTEAHLWRFAGVQNGPDGRFTAPLRYLSPYFMLRFFAERDHPAARVVLMRSLPWIVADQNADGSWGEGDEVEEATLAVIETLQRLGDELPEGLLPAARQAGA